MTEKQAEEWVRGKLEDYLKKMGQKPDQAGRYHCIAKDHTDGNPSMTIHKSGTYAMCWSHPSPKDTFNIFDAIGIFEGIHTLRAQKQRAYAIYGLTIDETSETHSDKKGTETKPVTPEPPAPAKHKQQKPTAMQNIVAVPPPEVKSAAKQPVWPAPAKAAPIAPPTVLPEQPATKKDDIPQPVAKTDAMSAPTKTPAPVIVQQAAPKPIAPAADLTKTPSPAPATPVSPLPEKKPDEKVPAPVVAKAVEPKPVIQPVTVPKPPVTTPVKPASPLPDKKPDEKVHPPVVAKAAEPKPAIQPVEVHKTPVPTPVTPVSPLLEKKADEKVPSPVVAKAVEPKPAIQAVDVPKSPAPMPATPVSPIPEKKLDYNVNASLSAKPVEPKPAMTPANIARSMADQFQQLVLDHRADTPLSTGFNALDTVLDGGFYPGVTLLCARPGEGKTSFALQIADHIARQGHDLCWISLDMTAREILVKSLSRLTLELDPTEAKEQALTSRQVMARLGRPDQPQILDRAVQLYRKFAGQIRFVEQLQPLALGDLVERLESLSAGDTRPVIVLDSLQYILPQAEGLNDVQQQDQSVRALMQFSRRHQLPVLALSGVIRDSYASDVIVSLQMEPAEGSLSSPHQIRLEIMKNRQGPAGQRQPYVFCAAYNAFAQR